MKPQGLTELESRLRTLLTAHPQGISEHALLKWLREDCPALFPAQLFADNLALYRAHFLLFHVLYRLRDTLLGERAGLLEIDVLRVRLLPYEAAQDGALTAPDPLAAHYRDLGNMHQTTAADVASLLGDFWGRYYANSQRGEALAQLGLSDPVSAEDIRRRYRELAMTHHPDRGGDAQCFQRLQQAMAVLRKC